MSRSISTVVWIFIKVQKCYKKFKLCNCYIPLSTFYRISTKGKDGSKHRTTTFDTVLESWDFILFNEKILGTIGVPLWVPFGTQSVPINVENFKKSIFYNTKIRHNGTQNGTPVVPKMSNGTQIVPKMVPKWYPNSLTHFIRRSIFMIFQVQKMATSPLWVPFWVPSRIFGYHRLFFWKTYHVSYLRKKCTQYLTIFTYLASCLWFFTKSRIFICGTNCIFWVP